MTPDEHAAALCGIAYMALLYLPHDSRARHEMQSALAMIRDQIARLRGQSTEDVQREFEGKVSS